MKKNNYFYIMIIWLSWIIWWIINYFYNPIMLKFMSIEDFWIFWSLVWLFNILWAFTTWFDLFLNKEFSKNIDSNRNKSIYFDSLKLFFIFWVFVFILFSIFSPITKWFLKIDSEFLIILTWLTLILAFSSIPTNALLRSLKYFEVISVSQILIPVLKLLLWVFLVFLWFNISWAIFWFILSRCLWTLYLMYFCIKTFKKEKYSSNIKWLLKDFLKNEKEIINFFLVSLFFTIFMNIDVILSRNLLSETQAWIYSWISVMWKFLLFLLLSIETIYFWQIMEHNKTEIPYHLIRNPILLILFSSFLWIFINVFLGWFILWMLSWSLVEYKDIYLLNLWYFSFLSFMSFFMKILVWWKNFKVNYICFFLFIFLIILIYTFWKVSLYNFALSFLIFWILSVFVLGIYFFITYKNIKSKTLKI